VAGVEDKASDNDFDESFTLRSASQISSVVPSSVTITQSHESLCAESNDLMNKLQYAAQYICDNDQESITLRPLGFSVSETYQSTHKIGLQTGTALICVLIRGNTEICEVSRWQARLNFSLDHLKIIIEGSFNVSRLFLCFIAMPISLWDMTIFNPAYRLICYADSHIMVPNARIVANTSCTLCELVEDKLATPSSQPRANVNVSIVENFRQLKA
jgi:hypothetical protein